MNPTLQQIHDELVAIAAQITGVLPNDQPLFSSTSIPFAPLVTRSDLAGRAQRLADLIQTRGKDDIQDAERVLSSWAPRFVHLRTVLIPNFAPNAQVAPFAYISGMEQLEQDLQFALFTTEEQQKQLGASVRTVSTRVRGMLATLNGLEPKMANLSSQLARIESAHDTADRLPIELEALNEAREEVRQIADKVAEILKEAQDTGREISEASAEGDILIEHLEEAEKEAADIVSRVEDAYSAATSQGLAAAFAQRSTGLERTVFWWVVGLVAALLAGAVFGSYQLSHLAASLESPSAQSSSVSIHLILSAFAVGGPVWFAWLATKQIGQRFRLSEDYAFKASVAKAYEGFRRETAKVDPALAPKLLASALSRLDEQPLRLVEADSFGSPWHELLASDTVKEAIKVAPSFATNIMDTARNVLKAKKRGEPVPQLPLLEPETEEG